MCVITHPCRNLRGVGVLGVLGGGGGGGGGGGVGGEEYPPWIIKHM